MENDNFLFGLKLFKTQLQDALTIIGKAILKDLDEKSSAMSDQEKLENLKNSMVNPFEEILKMTHYLNKEFKDFRDSPEITEHIKTLLKIVEDNPDVLDEIVEGSPEDLSTILEKRVKDKNKGDGNLQ